MSFQGADSLVDLLVTPFLVVWLLLPANALISIYRRRRNRPGASRKFAYAVMVLWVASPMIPVLLLFLGFGRIEGNSSEAELVQVTLMLLVMTAVHIALVIAGNAPKRSN
jgi:hypothetical protein